MANPYKLATRGRKTKQKHKKYVLDTITRKQTQITQIRHETSYKASPINPVSYKYASRIYSG
jgi:hypothetical protein